MSLAEAENPRARLGGNNPPPDEEAEDTKSPPTIEEITRVMRAIEYVKFRAPDMEDLLTKRKGGRIMGWRLALAWALKGSVRLVAVHTLLQLNRKTAGENQQRPEEWMKLNEDLEEELANFREAVYRDGCIDFKKTDKLLRDFIKSDPQLRTLEEQEKAHLKAAHEAESEAARLAALAEAKAIDRLKRSLKGVKGKQAILSEHKGSTQLAKEISEDCLRVVVKIVVREAKGGRYPASFFDKPDDHGASLAFALQQCIKLGLAKKNEPHLSKSADPTITPTDLAQRVYVAAFKVGRLKKKKKKPAAA